MSWNVSSSPKNTGGTGGTSPTNSTLDVELAGEGGVSGRDGDETRGSRIEIREDEGEVLRRTKDGVRGVETRDSEGEETRIVGSFTRETHNPALDDSEVPTLGLIE
ncbi:uncharacterized protein LOC105423836 [Pogonomyrmex barbatus]|uniref:Uncharacterized protein LOC105423836 n=1 Tax=Pogonomyrmex barbatus TaxID=144034 RepID=A0A6I9WJY4_9HYME|nr:uncharacterized protein LOC105423836 [Pogonomyrmex barbatus]